MSAPKTFVLRQVIALRVGTEVEITFFHEPKTSTWDGSIIGHEKEVVRHEAIVRDLETGVVYGAPGHFSGGELNPLLVVAETLRGRVVACQLRTGARSDAILDVECWLAIAPAPGGVYR